MLHRVAAFALTIISRDITSAPSPYSASLHVTSRKAAFALTIMNWCLSYNPTKSKVMLFGKQTVYPRFSMYGSPLDFAIEYNYLGVIVTAGKTFSTSHIKPLIRFRSAANTLLNVQRKPSENVSMRLLYSSCVPTHDLCV